MTLPKFFPGLLATTFLTVFLFGIEWKLLTSLQSQLPFMGLTLALFVALALAIYFTAIPASKSDNKARLAQYVMVLTFVKMALGIALVYGYFSYGNPPNRSFLFPFFTAYLCFTVYETLFLVKLSKSTS